ncbi:MAG: hypothetical protein P8H56_13245 [Crocinitomicaceae bacterium]|nr:hypothetical protein [Crocinitomicaceae bacterium]MDG1659538.1 hypothetical protein [Crocinitomicaceae bacterium]
MEDSIVFEEKITVLLGETEDDPRNMIGSTYDCCAHIEYHSGVEENFIDRWLYHNIEIDYESNTLVSTYQRNVYGESSMLEVFNPSSENVAFYEVLRRFYSNGNSESTKFSTTEE